MSRTDRVLKRHRREHPPRGCAEPGCPLEEAEHWFEYGSWHPHPFVPRTV